MTRRPATGGATATGRQRRAGASDRSGAGSGRRTRLQRTSAASVLATTRRARDGVREHPATPVTRATANAVARRATTSGSPAPCTVSSARSVPGRVAVKATVRRHPDPAGSGRRAHAFDAMRKCRAPGPATPAPAPAPAAVSGLLSASVRRWGYPTPSAPSAATNGAGAGGSETRLDADGATALTGTVSEPLSDGSVSSAETEPPETGENWIESPHVSLGSRSTPEQASALTPSAGGAGPPVAPVSVAVPSASGADPGSDTVIAPVPNACGRVGDSATTAGVAAGGVPGQSRPRAA